MITITDVIRAVSGMVERLFGEPPTSKDITEGFERPCTYVHTTGTDVDRPGDMRHDVIHLQIVRFAERSYMGWAELLRYQEALTMALLDPIPVDGMFFLYPEDVSVDLRRDEMAMFADFSVENFQLLPDADADEPEMENVILTRKD